MDPQVCLLEAAWEIIHDNKDAAANLLDTYVNWRGKGGYEPTMNIMMGDAYHRALIGVYEDKFGPYLDARLPQTV
jgi:hypothetical protein